MGNICCLDQKTIPAQLLPPLAQQLRTPTTLPTQPSPSHQHLQNQNGQGSHIAPFVLQQGKSDQLGREENEQLDQIQMNLEDSTSPLHTYSVPVVVKKRETFSGMTDKSYKDSTLYLKHYNRHNTHVQPPSLIENSVQMSVIGNSYKLGRLMSSKLRLEDSYHVHKAVAEEQSVPSFGTKN